MAYRMIGDGPPIIFCNRFRGVLDTWDPLFLDAVAANYKVIIFDYLGIGSSSGEIPIDIAVLAEDVKALAAFLSIQKAILLGWSFGGFVAQAATFLYPDFVTHTILLGTNPPGRNDEPFEEAFLKAALKPLNDLEDELILFFEPASALSKAAGKASHERISKRLDVSKIPASQDVFQRYFAAGDTFRTDQWNFRGQLLASNKPVLVIIGDHDVSFPVKNWLVLVGKLEHAQIVVLPRTGHGPQHQYPAMVAGYMDSFIRHFYID